MTVPRLAREELARAAPGRDAAVTVGKFDGVHRGHQHLIHSFIKRARQEALASVVITLHPNPMTVLRPGSVVTYLCSLEERLELLRALGPDSVGILSFTSELSLLSPREFVSLLVQALRMKLLFVGPDLALGRNREGDIEVLRVLGQELSYGLEVAPLLAESSEKVGSSAIRQALSLGQMERVAQLLGRPYSLRGPVVPGEGRGKSLGFPTANVAVAPDRALPAFGVYVTRAVLGESAHASCTNIGVRPTFELEEPRTTIETYILDFQGDLYGQELRIDLLHRLRDELRFESVPALIDAIQQDVAQTREYFRSW